MADPYMDKINENWDNITGMYVKFEDKLPIIEFDPNSLIIIAYPAKDYISGLSKRTRDNTMEQYKTASASGSMMVFVRDEVIKVLRSYIFPKNDEEC